MARAANSGPILTQPATAQCLSRGLPAGIRMLQLLGLNREEQALLLGLNPRRLHPAAQQQGLELTQAQLTRLSLVVDLYGALHILYNPDAAAGWLKRANARHPFGGQTPLEHMRRGGLPAMYEVRRLLTTYRTGQFRVTSQARLTAAHFGIVGEL